ncbi:MAG: hypothetical protein CL678_03765 [Bdellovibrionaceae bacterium]|nr:hypothetical protein [Pseudobdellovibrionaceae bacterium]
MWSLIVSFFAVSLASAGVDFVEYRGAGYASCSGFTLVCLAKETLTKREAKKLAKEDSEFNCANDGGEPVFSRATAQCNHTGRIGSGRIVECSAKAVTRCLFL